MIALALFAALAVAGPTETYAWDISLNGNIVGERTLTVEHVDDVASPYRSLKMWTQLDASVLGRSASFQQRVTAVANVGPAAFHSAVQQDGVAREFQGRRDGIGWTITSVERRGVRTEDLPSNAVDLSTADLMDPESRVPIWTFEHARILTTEDGLIYQTPVTRLGTDQLQIGGETVLVEGYEIEPPAGKMQLWYSASGALVKYRWGWMGVRAEGVLRDPPPQRLDAIPVDGDEAGVTEVEL